MRIKMGTHSPVMLSRIPSNTETMAFCLETTLKSQYLSSGFGQSSHNWFLDFPSCLLHAILHVSAQMISFKHTFIVSISGLKHSDVFQSLLEETPNFLPCCARPITTDALQRYFVLLESLLAHLQPHLPAVSIRCRWILGMQMLPVCSSLSGALFS